MFRLAGLIIFYRRLEAESRTPLHSTFSLITMLNGSICQQFRRRRARTVITRGLPVKGRLQSKVAVHNTQGSKKGRVQLGLYNTEKPD